MAKKRRKLPKKRLRKQQRKSAARSRKARERTKRSKAAKAGWITRRRNARKKRKVERKRSPRPSIPSEIKTITGLRHVKGFTVEWYGYPWQGMASFDDIQVAYEQLENPGEIFAWYLLLVVANQQTETEALIPWSTPFSTDRADVTREAKEFAETVLAGGLEKYKQVTGIFEIWFGVGRKENG